MYLSVTEYLYRTQHTSLTGISLIDFNNHFLKQLQQEFTKGVDHKHLFPVPDLTPDSVDNSEGQASKDNTTTPDRSRVHGLDKDATDLTTGNVVCTICMGDVEDPKTLGCGHSFCTPCIDNWSQQKPVCPMCGRIFGQITGNQPKDGKMLDSVINKLLPGYEKTSEGTIQIQYTFPSGKQTV